MFRTLRLSIFIYYFATVSTFIAITYYLLRVVDVQNIFLLSVVVICFILLSAVFISKLAIDPLSEHVKNLQNLSTETLHELNLPISTIKTNLQMIKKNTIDDKTLKRVTRIDNACQMLQQRYNELDYMIKTQTLQIVKENFNLKDLVNDRVNFLKSIYPNVDFVLSLKDTHIYCDKIGLSKAIDNIIDNGVKYSPNSDRIEITLDDYELEIKDYGCGMDEVELIQIFDNYYQSNGNMQGFGIGLGMVKRFSDRQNINLNIKSKPDFGTSVTLKFNNKKG